MKCPRFILRMLAKDHLYDRITLGDLRFKRNASLPREISAYKS